MRSVEAVQPDFPVCRNPGGDPGEEIYKIGLYGRENSAGISSHNRSGLASVQMLITVYFAGPELTKSDWKQ